MRGLAADRLCKASRPQLLYRSEIHQAISKLRCISHLVHVYICILYGCMYMIYTYPMSVYIPYNMIYDVSMYDWAFAPEPVRRLQRGKAWRARGL